MNDSEFHRLADQLMLQVEQSIDQAQENEEVEIDYENQNGVMTLFFSNGSKIVINRQEPLRQIWVASKQGGYHFNYRHGAWYCDKSGIEFYQLLSTACSQHCGMTVALSQNIAN